MVAEGIESEAVRSELEALGCDSGQGFLFARPMPAEVFAGWLNEREQLVARRIGLGAATLLPLRPERDRRPLTSVGRRLLHVGRRAVDQVGGFTLIAALVMFVAYGLWQVFRWGGHQHQVMIGDLAFVPLNGAAATLAWRVSRRRSLGVPTCRAWRLLSVALGLYLLGDALRLLYDVVLPVRAYPTWADAAYLSFYVVALAGILSFPSRRQTRPGSRRGTWNSRRSTR